MRGYGARNYACVNQALIRESGPWVLVYQGIIHLGLVTHFLTLNLSLPPTNHEAFVLTLCEVLFPFRATFCIFTWFHLIKKIDKWWWHKKTQNNPLGWPQPDTWGSPLAPLEEDWTNNGASPGGGAQGQRPLCRKRQTWGWSHYKVPRW